MDVSLDVSLVNYVWIDGKKWNKRRYVKTKWSDTEWNGIKPTFDCLICYDGMEQNSHPILFLPN